MLESLISPKKAKPFEVFVFSLIFTLIAFLFSFFLFPEYSSVLGCAFLTILFVPFFQHLFLDEEKKEEWITKHRTRENIFRRHEHVITFYSSFFLGVILALSFLHFFIPDKYRNIIFEKQISELRRISSLSSASTVSPLSSKIFLNNTMVLILAFISSFLFGTGAVFILSWNASVISVFASTWAQSLVLRGFPRSVAFLYGIPNALISIALHGIPEIFGYFFAGFAGGILSVGLLRERIGTKEFRKIIVDSLVFLLLGEYCIFIAAFIETGSIILSVVEFLLWVITMGILFSGARVNK